jgi:ubiquinone/menaquinone biosynthesis C-methylase UbiE
MPVVREHTLDLVVRSAPQTREYEAIADRIARDAPGRVLDWGCGLGQVTMQMARRGLDVTSYDWRPDHPEPVTRPFELFPEYEATFWSDPVALPYPDAAFDAVLSCGVLEHVHDPDGSLEELKRVLEPGGTLYVYKLPNRLSYLEAIARRIGTVYWHGKEANDRLYDLRSAREILERHGYTVHELRLANMLPLTLPGKLVDRLSGVLWGLNRLLARIPGLNRFATNVEAVATAPR